jgi:hypothetical protein
MAKMVLTGAYLSLSATTLHNLGVLKKAELVVEVEDKDVTNYNSAGWKEYLGGLKSGTLACEFFQDYAAGAVDATLFGIVGSVVPIEIRGSSAAASATNPKYTGSAILETYQPVGGSVGDNLMAPVTMSGVGALTRATS